VRHIRSKWWPQSVAPSHVALLLLPPSRTFVHSIAWSSALSVDVGHPCFFCRSSTGEGLCCSEDLRSGASLVSKVSITVIVQSRLLILSIHATAHRLFSASILVPPLFFAHSYSSHFASCCGSSVVTNNSVFADDPAFGKPLRSRSSHSSHSVSFTVIAIALRAISSPCRYRYPPRSTEPIPWSSSCCPTDHVTLSLSLYSHIVAATVISVSQVILLLSSCRCRCRPLHPRHKSQHLSLAGARPLERCTVMNHVT
jgi:hypothetical protein